MGRQVAQVGVDFVVAARPLQAAVQQGVGTVGPQLVGSLVVLVHEIGAGAVLHPQRPRSAQPVPDAMRQRGCKLMAQVLHGIVGLEVRFVVAPMLIDVGVAHLQPAERLPFAPQAIEQQLGRERGAVVVQLEVGRMIDVIGRAHHPVYHVRAAVVIGLDLHRGKTPSIVHSYTPSRTFLGTQADIALLGGTLIIQIGKRGQPQRAVPGSIKPPVRTRTETEVHTGVEAKTMVDGGVTLGHHAGRECPLAPHNVVFQKITYVGAVIMLGIAETILPRYVHILRFVERTAQVGAVNGFFAHLSA